MYHTLNFHILFFWTDICEHNSVGSVTGFKTPKLTGLPSSSSKSGFTYRDKDTLKSTLYARPQVSCQHFSFLFLGAGPQHCHRKPTCIQCKVQLSSGQ